MSDTQIFPTTYLDLPTSDGQPMGETEAHGIEMTEFLRDILRDHYAEDRLVYVASNNFLYYDPGNVKKKVSPDSYVIKGVPKIVRDSYQSWAEGGILPCLVFELTSASTWRVDIDFKRNLYQSWACHEYFLYDLRAERILQHLLGYRLVNGVYQEIPLTLEGRLFSEELQLELAHQDGHLRFFTPGNSKPIPTRLEKALQAEQDLALAEEEKNRGERERVRLECERARLENERARLECEREEERLRAETAELENKRLREEIARLREGHQVD